MVVGERNTNKMYKSFFINSFILSFNFVVQSYIRIIILMKTSRFIMFLRISSCFSFLSKTKLILTFNLYYFLYKDIMLL